MKTLWVFWILATQTAAAFQGFPQLETIAKESIQFNLNTLTSGTFLSAGAHQFKGLWTRDFCFASRGLAALGRYDVIRDQLELILKFMRDSDDELPRYLDSMTDGARYAALTFGIRPPVGNHLRPNFGHAVDSNLLILLTAVNYVNATGDFSWWDQHQNQLAQLYANTLSFRDNSGLIVQPENSDWQDSVSRTGKTFYTNILFFAVSQRLPFSKIDLSALRRQIDFTFFDSGTQLYRSIEGSSFISLDGILLAIDLDYVSETDALLLYESLKIHPLWTSPTGPGFVTYPNYPIAWVAVGPQLYGLRHYHDEMYWSWLMGLSAKIARKMGDASSADRIFDRLQKMAVRDSTIAEIYSPIHDLPPFHSFLYHSEQPFSWGAGMILDALHDDGK